MEIFVDTHCHLDFEDLVAEQKDILARAKQVGVLQIITIGIDFASSQQASALAEANGEVYSTVGIHPHNASDLSSADKQELLTLGRKPRVVAYGEIGLDFYRNYQPRSLQTACLNQQLELAKQLRLPVVIHNREAHEEIYKILRQHKVWEMGGAMHCFSGDWSLAQKYLDLGLHLSIAGPVTFANSHLLHDVVRNCPLERLLLETDAPFLAPVPKRGKRNEPAFLIHTAEKIAALNQLSLAAVAKQTTLNARQLFRLPNPTGD